VCNPEEKDVKWKSKNGCDGRLMAKIFNNNSCEFGAKHGEGNTKLSELLL